ncbi:Atrial natriuretic peptide receptor 2 [Manis javanica]|nr:Atrial natriuretic peptide receptor 2 [Manis javanica]
MQCRRIKSLISIWMLEPSYLHEVSEKIRTMPQERNGIYEGKEYLSCHMNEHLRPGARRCEGRPGPGRRTRPARDGERQCLPAQHTIAPRLPPRRLLLLGTASPSAAPERAAASAGPGEPLCVQPNEGRRRNHLTEALALDAPSARMRRRRGR